MKKALLIFVIILVPVFLATSVAAYEFGLITPSGQCRDDIGDLEPCPPEYMVTLKSGGFYTANSTFSFELDLGKTYCNCEGSPKLVALPISISKVILSGTGQNWTGSSWRTFATIPNTICVGNFTPLSTVGNSMSESCAVSGITFVQANSSSSAPQPYYLFTYMMSFSDGQTFSGTIESQ